jgi:hypothetical protein
MCVRPLAGFGLVLALALRAGAAEAAESGGPQRYSPPSQPVSLVSELRIGGSAQDPWSAEKGSANLTGEVLLAKPFTTGDLFTSYFVPRPHLGGSLPTPAPRTAA